MAENTHAHMCMGVFTFLQSMHIFGTVWAPLTPFLYSKVAKRLPEKSLGALNLLNNI